MAIPGHHAGGSTTPVCHSGPGRESCDVSTPLSHSGNYRCPVPSLVIPSSLVTTPSRHFSRKTSSKTLQTTRVGNTRSRKEGSYVVARHSDVPRCLQVEGCTCDSRSPLPRHRKTSREGTDSVTSSVLHDLFRLTPPSSRMKNV